MPPRSGRHTSILRQDDTLLVVLDMQEPFLKAIYEREQLVSNVSTLIQSLKILRIQIVPTQQNTEKMGHTILEIKQKLPSLCMPYDKLTFSAWGDSTFVSELHRSGKKQIILCGVEAHICVCQTALDILANGFQVHVIADAVSSRTKSNWEAGLNKMEQNGVYISTTEMAIYELLGEAGTSEFKEILALVK